MKEIQIKFLVSESDPLVTIDSKSLNITYSHVGREGKGKNLHSLQCMFAEDSENYEKLFKLLDNIADCSREIYNMRNPNNKI